MSRHVYSLIRFVPDPARAEFVNIGAIAGSEETQDWQIRTVENFVRARAMDLRRAVGAVHDFVDEIGRAIDEYDESTESLLDPAVELTEEWMAELALRHRNIVQVTAPIPVAAESADEALDQVFELLILDPAQRSFRFKKKTTARAAVRKAYSDRLVKKGDNLFEKVNVRTRHHAERMDFAVANGRVLQLTHTWSFQMPDQEQLAENIKAWGWTVHDLRKSGGSVVAGKREYALASDVDIAVVYVPAETDDPAPAWNDAESVFQEVGAQVSSLTQANTVAQRAEKLLQESRGGRLDLG